MIEFQVNKYITLRLEYAGTNIYVKDELFNQCKFLLLNISVEEISVFDEIESIDEAAGKYEQIAKRQTIKGKNFVIPPEVEFWAHCSNLQVWVENNYNTKLIHSHLAFPLLKKLMEVGDVQAKRVFKEELIKRIKSDYEPVIEYLIREEFTNVLNFNDFGSIIGDEAIVLKELKKIIPLSLWLVLDDEFFTDGTGFVIKDQRVIKLSLLGCYLRLLPKSIEDLAFLQYLNLDLNELSELPETIGNLKALEELSLNNNQLTSLPESIGNLTHLKELWIANNKLTELPESIGNLASLEVLNLEENSLTSIPESVFDLPSLRELWIKGNKIESIPEVEKNPLLKIYY